MKGPYTVNKVYAIAGVASAGFAGGVISAVYAYDNRTAENLFFTIGVDEIEDADGDVYSLHAGEELRMDSGVDAGWRVPERQVLSLWSDREEALVKHGERSTRGKQAAQSKKDREAAELRAKWSAEEAAKAATAEGRLEAIPGVDNVFRIIRGDRDVVMFSMKLKPDTFRKISLALGIDQELVEEWLIESEEKIKSGKD